jgi:hypothetical protein
VAEYLDSGARLSTDGRYRYLLWREWRGSHDPENWDWLGDADGAGQPLGEPRPCLFVMLNPSTADAAQDDPTIRRCVSFARAWQFERLEVVNLFAFRSTSPAGLLALSALDDPVGPENLEHVRDAAERAGRIVCAWGAYGGFLGQDQTVLGWMGDRLKLALGFTKGGHPRHPLYVKKDARAIAMVGRG